MLRLRFWEVLALIAGAVVLSFVLILFPIPKDPHQSDKQMARKLGIYREFLTVWFIALVFVASITYQGLWVGVTAIGTDWIRAQTVADAYATRNGLLLVAAVVMLPLVVLGNGWLLRKPKAAAVLLFAGFSVAMAMGTVFLLLSVFGSSYKDYPETSALFFNAGAVVVACAIPFALGAGQLFQRRWQVFCKRCGALLVSLRSGEPRFFCEECRTTARKGRRCRQCGSRMFPLGWCIRCEEYVKRPPGNVCPEHGEYLLDVGKCTKLLGGTAYVLKLIRQSRIHLPS